MCSHGGSMKPRDERTIYFCPRFHVNFYHSYRGDTADEQGFGKDIRIIRGILDDLEKLETEGISVHCAWDFDNVFSLGHIIPRHAPDILNRIKDRVATGRDEIHLMSWNNGLLSAHTPEEFKLAVEWALKAPDGSGNIDVFSACTSIVRPQECMVTPSHLKLYKQLGIETLSVYYSAIPFNGFGSFVPKLGIAERYNPLLLVDGERGESMRLLPAINQGDLAEYGLSARRMLKRIRRKQLSLAKPTDLIVLLDMDADDTFWEGFLLPPLSVAAPSFAGLYHLVKSIAGLGYVSFIKPSEYLANHENAGTITFAQDLADGAFDGFASWAEKYENHVLWTMVTQGRTYWDAAKSWVIASNHLDPSSQDDFHQWSAVLPQALQKLAMQTMRTRLQVLSTTHFGLSAPVMNVHRLQAATLLAEDAITQARILLEHVMGAGASVPGDIEIPHWKSNPLHLEPSVDGALTLQTHYVRHVVKAPWVMYDKLVHRSTSIAFNASIAQGTISLGTGESASVHWRRTARIDERLQVLCLDCLVEYPSTKEHGYDNLKAQRLGRTWDERWKQVAPCEIIAFETIPLTTTITVWKEDFGGAVSSYPLDYYAYGGNKGLCSINNHVTPSWIALSDGSSGLLIAQSHKHLHGFAFCPLRQTITDGKQTITANPFGTYWGEQYTYPARTTGWGRTAALLTAEHLHSSAPSYEGEQVHFSLLLATYQGSRPPKELCLTARVFSETGELP